MYVIHIIDYIHHLLNKNLKNKKLLIFETGGSILFLVYKAKTKEKKRNTKEIDKREVHSQIKSSRCIILKKIQKIRWRRLVTKKLKG